MNPPCQRQADPAALVVGDLHGVDHLLHPEPVGEVAFIPWHLAQHLAGEVSGQVRVIQRAPGLPRAAARRIEALRHSHLAELHVIGPGDLQRLADAELLDEPGDRGALGAVDPDLDARVVADGDEAALNRADRAARELADEDVAVIDVHPGHRAGAASMRSGMKLRMTPTTAVRSEPMNQCPMSITGAP